MKNGFSLLEVILAAALFGIFAVALLSALSYGNSTAIRATERGRATYVAEEGLEAVRSIRSVNFSALTNGTFGLLTVTGGQWALTGTSDTTGHFTRVITISDHNTLTKKIITTISWPDTNGETISTTLTTLLSNWQSATPAVCGTSTP